MQPVALRAVSVSLQCSRGLRTGWSPVPQGQSLVLHPCAPIWYIQTLPLGSTGVQNWTLNPGTGRHLLQNLLFRLQAGKTLSSLQVLLQAVSCGNLPRSPLRTHCPEGLLLPVARLLSPARTPCFGKGAPPCLGTGSRRLLWCSGGGWHGYCTQGTPTVMPITSPY